MTEHHDPAEELHGLKARLAHLREDLHAVLTDTGATVRHYGQWNQETAKAMMDDIDYRLGKAIAGLEAKMAGASPEERKGLEEAAAGLTALKEDLDVEYGMMGDGTADHETIRAVENFHDRVDDHLAYLRKSGREW